MSLLKLVALAQMAVVILFMLNSFQYHEMLKRVQHKKIVTYSWNSF
jgi:hypothetical protein